MRKKRPEAVVPSDSSRLKSYEIMGLHVTVSHDFNPVVAQDVNLAGTYRPMEAHCAILPEMVDRPRQEVECHEVAESWNDMLGLELGHGKIQALGGALHQFLRTAVFEELEE